MTKYKIKLDVCCRSKSRHKLDFIYFLRKILKTAKQTNMTMVSYEEGKKLRVHCS